MVTIDVYDALITYQSKGAGGRLEAEEGFSIECKFTLENKISDTKSIWWAIHDHVADKRLKSGTGTLSPGSTINVDRHITMPDHDIHIKYWTGTVGADGIWYWTDSADMPKIYLKAPPAPTTGSVNVKATVSGAPDVVGAEITVDGGGTGVYTPGTVEVSPGYHLISVINAGYVAVVQGLTVVAGSTYDVSVPLTPETTICDITPTISPPSSLSLKPPATGVMPDIDSVPSLPVGMVFTPSCLDETGSPVTAPSNLFPFGEFEVVVTIDGIEVLTGSIPSTGSILDLKDSIKTMISNGLITTDTDSISLEIWYPKTIEFLIFEETRSVTEYTTYSKTIPVSIPKPIICGITPDISSPSSLSLKPPAAGVMPDLGSVPSFPIDILISTSCLQAGSPVIAPYNLFPMDVSMSLAGVDITGGSLPGVSSTRDLKDSIKSLISSGTITTATDSIELKIRYPKTVTFPEAGGAGKVTEYTTYSKTIPVSIPVPVSIPEVTPPGIPVSIPEVTPPGVEELLCAITGTLTNIPSIPITIPASGFPSLGLGSIPVNLSLSSVCNKNGSSVATPAGMFGSLSAEVFIGSTKVGNIYPNSSGLASFDLTSFASTLLSGVTGSTSKILTVRYPSSVKIGSVEVLGTTDITKTITLSLGAAPPPGPGCTEGTFMSPFTCPDRSIIQLLKCVDGVWVSSGQTCPPAPECTEGTFMSPFTCPDGSVIYLLKCVDGKWVSSGHTCPPPPGCTEDTFMSLFTCPDGSVIDLLKCVDGKWVSSGQTCPPAPKLETKMVYVLAPMLTRVGKKITIVAKVYCGTKPSGGETTSITVNGKLLTTTNTRGGEATASYAPVEPGIYSICATVPESSACNASGSSCTTIQVVSELSAPEIKAAEEEFEKSKERIGEIMERI